ncbi:LysR family transcriptional regulator [Allopusillimonas soli]|uniref:LysR family transcriptional regulator n=1 Tax=Allopusillimonas soli TaxID=659016 RepID=A0A853FAJ4_9BURK|nr:LysR substrate-binding domain-containing protein [Allopusillimonas soli]NYT35581.1 LysR family transcriptional regulator [Allopusillimonas soli]TEA75984.1 LysR family transcriptional regulator [Allopusillimonas soli]
MRVIPNLNALRMFEATARYQSFARAADELCVTHSAVYKQITALEEKLDVRLFKRVKKRIFLTPQGSEYALRVRAALQRLGRDTEELVARGHLTSSIEIAVPLSFGVELLVPKLPEFCKKHPDIQVHLSVRNRPFLFSSTPFDGAIIFGTRAWEGTTGFTLLREGTVVPVCNEAIGESISTATDILDQPLLHLTSRLDDWERWAAANNIHGDIRVFRGLRFDQFALLTSTAIAGLGVCLAPLVLVERELAEKRLMVPIDTPMHSDRELLFIRPTQAAPSDALMAFQDWLIGAYS